MAAIHDIPLQTWRESIETRRRREEQRWAELARAGEQLVSHLRFGDRAAAVDSARMALDLEYELTGDCAATSALLDVLGLTVEETELDS